MISSSRSGGQVFASHRACLSRRLSHASLLLRKQWQCLPRLRQSRITLRVVDVGARSFRREGVLLAGQDGERGCDLG
jgi:hypothetical protein